MVVGSSDWLGSVGSRFSDRDKVLREAEAFCEEADAVDAEDRIHEEHMCLAIWDELRRIRRENARLREAITWAEQYVPKRADCETRRMIESLLPNVDAEPRASGSAEAPGSARVGL